MQIFASESASIRVNQRPFFHFIILLISTFFPKLLLLALFTRTFTQFLALNWRWYCYGHRVDQAPGRESRPQEYPVYLCADFS